MVLTLKLIGVYSTEDLIATDGQMDYTFSFSQQIRARPQGTLVSEGNGVLPYEK